MSACQTDADQGRPVVGAPSGAEDMGWSEASGRSGPGGGPCRRRCPPARCRWQVYGRSPDVVPHLPPPPVETGEVAETETQGRRRERRSGGEVLRPGGV